MKRILALLLSLLLLASCAAAPDEKPSETDRDAPAAVNDAPEAIETEPALAPPSLPEDLAFGDAAFAILTGWYTPYCWVTVEEMNGEVLNDAKYDMQRLTEERLGVKISEQKEAVGNVPVMVEKAVKAGDDAWAAVNLLDRFSVSLMLRGCLRELKNAEYLDLNAPWWLPATTSELTVGGKCFMATSPSTLLMWGDTIGIFIDSDLANIVGADVDAIFDSVREGSWTFDKMMEYAALAVGDLNGDGRFTEDADRFGLVFYDGNIWGTSVVRAGGFNSLRKDADGNLEVAWDDERYLDLISLAYDIFHRDGVLYLEPRHSSGVFAEGRSLFMHGFFEAVDTLKDMEHDYTIVPIPKYEETQDSYECANYDVMTYILPICVSDTAMFGAVLEWLSYEGFRLVRPAYIETTMKYKAARDERMAEMVQVCLDASRVDVGSIYCYDQCSYDALYLGVIDQDSFKFSSFTASKSKILGKALDKIAAAIDNLPG